MGGQKTFPIMVGFFGSLYLDTYIYIYIIIYLYFEII